MIQQTETAADTTDSETSAADAEGLTAVQVASETMLGDLMQITLDELKAAYDPWQKLSQSSQDTVIARIENRCREVVSQAVKFIAAEGKATVSATIDQVVFKDGIKATISASRGNPDRHHLADATGESCLLVLPAIDRFMGGAGRHTSSPDQLPLYDGDDDGPVADAGSLGADDGPGDEE